MIIALISLTVNNDLTALPIKGTEHNLMDGVMYTCTSDGYLTFQGNSTTGMSFIYVYDSTDTLLFNMSGFTVGTGWVHNAVYVKKGTKIQATGAQYMSFCKFVPIN